MERITCFSKLGFLPVWAVFPAVLPEDAGPQPEINMLPMSSPAGDVLADQHKHKAIPGVLPAKRK